MAKRTKQETMSEVLRKAIVESGVPLLTIEQETGIARASVRRFINGERSLRLDKADALAQYFDLSLIRQLRG